MTRNSEERSTSLFVQALNEDAQVAFIGCPGREFILGEFHAWDNCTSMGISVIFYPCKEINYTSIDIIISILV